jgi:hypothetical protein
MAKKRKRPFRKAFDAAVGACGYEMQRKPPFLPDDVDCSNSYWQKWIAQAPLEFANIYQKNRAFQRSVSEWITEEAHASSLWSYGVRQGPEALKAVEQGITYTDLLVFLSRFLEKVSYLEIGVSAGKNFMQVCRQLEHAALCGVDIEQINPVIEATLSDPRVVWSSERTYPFTTNKGTVHDKRFTLKRGLFEENGNTVQYLSGDKFHGDLWEALAGTQFNLVFSDACHIPDSIETEMDFLLKYDLVDRNEFIMFWDDLRPKMIPAFLRNVAKLRDLFKAGRPHAAVYEMHGTYGGDPARHGLHTIGAFFHREDLRPRSADAAPLGDSSAASARGAAAVAER